MNVLYKRVLRKALWNFTITVSRYDCRNYIDKIWKLFKNNGM